MAQHPHIPSFIAKAPWYMQSAAQQDQLLDHQRNTQATPQDPQSRAQLAHTYHTKPTHTQHNTNKRTFVKGACDNCGETGHNPKQCVQRPRKKNARFSAIALTTHNSTCSNDHETLQSQLPFDAKRDRWGAFAPESYQEVIQSFDDKKGQLKDTEAAKDKEKEESGARTLRIREDKAKYLRNLNIDSAHYDPKTRAMRENPNPDINPQDADFAGDNFLRYTGETKEATQIQLFAWEKSEQGASHKGMPLDPFSNPSLTELAFRMESEDKAASSKLKKEALTKKYGEQQRLEDKQFISDQINAESYTEFEASGKQVSEQALTVPRSKYEEDVWPGNHRSIWGSYYRDGQWGYACCHQLVKSSYCIGEKGKTKQNTSS
jgi:pre-mRNA-processing factor SLU7